MASTRRGLASFSTWFSFPQVFLWGWFHTDKVQGRISVHISSGRRSWVRGQDESTWRLHLKVSGSIPRAPLGFEHTCT